MGSTDKRDWANGSTRYDLRPILGWKKNLGAGCQTFGRDWRVKPAVLGYYLTSYPTKFEPVQVVGNNREWTMGTRIAAYGEKWR
jgi:hypothetical protein